MNFSAISNKTLFGRISRIPLRLIPPSMVVRVLQGPLRGSRWIVGSGVHGYWLGSYEWEKQEVLSTLAKPGQTVYDIGANAGFYSLLAAKLVGPQGKVIAFEPVPINLDHLRKHVQLNRLANVEMVDAAITDRVGTASFSYGKSALMGHLTESPADFTVSTYSLDYLVDEMRIPSPDVMKIDVEGAELGVLQGAARTLEQYSPAILLATHSESITRACKEFLHRAHYSASPLLDDRGNESASEFLTMPESDI